MTIAPITPPVSSWGNSFGYDGFGNLLSQTPTAGNAPNMSINVNTATNRVVATGVQYDAAGNMTNDGTQGYTYDEANRIQSVGSYQYGYSGLENKRTLVLNSTNPNVPVATFNLYGPDGKRLGWFTFSSSGSGWTAVTPGAFQNYLYLGSKALTYTEDRIGSNGNFYPYGTPYSGTVPSESQAFGTYAQDESGLMYADQRFYTSRFGRFMTADRSNANIDYGNPTSWNRYGYMNGDPVNGMDPTGQDCITPGGGYVTDGDGLPTFDLTSGCGQGGLFSPYWFDPNDPALFTDEVSMLYPNQSPETNDGDPDGGTPPNSGTPPNGEPPTFPDVDPGEPPLYGFMSSSNLNQAYSLCVQTANSQLTSDYAGVTANWYTAIAQSPNLDLASILSTGAGSLRGSAVAAARLTSLLEGYSLGVFAKMTAGSLNFITNNIQAWQNYQNFMAYCATLYPGGPTTPETQPEAP